MKVVLDTNVFVSALLKPKGQTSRIVVAWLDGRFDLLVHPILMAELADVSRREWFRQRVRRIDAARLLAKMKRIGILVGKLPNIRRSEDAFDDFLLGIAEAGAADFLVTGDKPGLLALKSHGRTKIVAARAFIDQIQA